MVYYPSVNIVHMDSDAMTPDETWMMQALTLAKKGIGTTSPNPPVGAIIVKDGTILGEGYHERAGELHAERRAIQNALERGNREKLPGSTIYVTLEPCSSHGKTPPCTDAILEWGISRVVYGAVDPDKRHRGRADALLSSMGVCVQGRVAEEACKAFLRPWMHAVENGRPWVTAKIAATLDGRIVRQRERWLSSEESLCYAHQLRAESDAILVGGNTVRKDNPALTIRRSLFPVPECKQQPWRIVLTRNKDSLPLESTLFTDSFSARTLVFQDADNLQDLLHMLYREYGIIRLMLECGGNLLRSFLEQGLVNEWVQIITPYLSGGEQWLLPGDYMPVERQLARKEVFPCGQDVILRGLLT